MRRPAPDATSRRILYGTDEAPPASLPLRAGPLTLALRAGALHGFAWHGRPTWHAVTFPYRDPDWGTPPFAAAAATVEERDGGFRAEVRGAFAVLPRLRTRFSAAADAEGRLRVEAEAVSDGDLATNRTGLCLLLPTAAAGDRIEVEHDDGRVTGSTVPYLVAPWPPFTAIRTLRWRVAPHRWAVAAFSGDSFEFEDQRNNADLSFKVYSRSNMMPRPYWLRAGEPVRQALEAWVEALPSPSPGAAGGAPVPASRDGSPGRAEVARSRLDVRDDPYRGTPPEPPHPLHGREGRWPASHPTGEGACDGATGRTPPRFGLAVPLDADRGLLRRATAALRPAYLHASLHVDALAAVDLAAVPDAGAPLHLELTLGDRPLSDADLARLVRARPEAVALFPSRPRDVEALRHALPGVAVGGGTPHFFAQVNRIEGLGPVDHLTFTVSPLVHGADDDDVMACPRSMPGLVATLRHRRPGLPIHLGPSAIAMRASPLGRMPPSDGLTRRAMAGDDPRARGLYGAAWALAFAAAATAAGVAAATLMAVDGPSGVASRRDGAFVWHPVSAVLQRLGGVAEAVPAPVRPAPRLAALAFRRGATRELLLANLGVEPLEVDLDDWAAGAVIGLLDEAALREADPRNGPPRFARRPADSGRLTLASYAVAQLRDGPAPGEPRR